MKRYDNGERVTKERIQDEPWYPDYQEFLECACLLDEGGDDVNTVYEAVMTGTMIPWAERILRWSVLFVEREKHKPAFLPELPIKGHWEDRDNDGYNDTWVDGAGVA